MSLGAITLARRCHLVTSPGVIRRFRHVARLRQAPSELYVERSCEQPTVTDISDRAGLTARTFFRHFADKREEVLFDGSIALQERLVQTLEGAPAAASPMGQPP
jgi:AcrR family transcriptional regulator